MRNLKRALSLALASVMLVGMMVVGTSAVSYPDVDHEDNIEAIAVLEAVEVMIGNENGEFEPDKNVTRNEMAVILAKLILGSDADKYVGSHPFNDVPSWADKYVAACYNEGIVAGRGEGIYDGNAVVTAQEAAAMVLRTLGYEKLEGTGTNWAQPVVAKANAIRLFKDVGSSATAPMNRNQVAQLTLNALKADVVETTSGANIDLGEIGSITTDVKYEEVKNKKADDYRTVADDKDEIQQLCEKLYGTDLKLGESADHDEKDAMGRPAKFWVYDGKDVFTVVDDAKYVVVLEKSYTDDQKLRDLAKSGLKDVDGGAAVTLNGDTSSYTALGAGDIVEFYMGDGADSNKVKEVFASRYALDKITDVDTDVDAKDEDVDCYVDFKNSGTKVKNTEIPGFNANYEKDAYVAVLVNDDGDIVDSYIPELFSGSIDTMKSGEYVNFDGDRHYLVKNYGSSIEKAALTANADDEFDLYLDENGFVLGGKVVKGSAAKLDEVYYLDTVWKTTGGVGGKVATYHAQIVSLADGTKEEIELEQKDHSLGNKGNANLGDASYSNYDALTNMLVTISDKKETDSKASNDKYNLKVWGNSVNDDFDVYTDVTFAVDKAMKASDSRIEVETGSSLNGGTAASSKVTFRLNGATNYVFLEGANNDLDVSTYTGGVSYTFSAANMGSAAKAIVITEDGSSLAQYMIIPCAKSDTKGSYSDEVIFIKSASGVKGDGYRVQEVYLPDGSKEEWEIADDQYTGLTVPGFFTYTENKDGYYELDAADNMTYTNGNYWKDEEGAIKDATIAKGALYTDDAASESFLTVTAGGKTLKDIDVTDAVFVDAHDKDGSGQYTKKVSSLKDLCDKVGDAADGKAGIGAATLYLNVSKDGAQTIILTDATDKAAVKTPVAPVVKIASADTNGITLTETALTAGAEAVTVAGTDFADGSKDSVKFTIDNTANAGATATATLSVASAAATDYTAGTAADIASAADSTGIALVLKVTVSGTGYTTTEFTYNVKVTVA